MIARTHENIVSSFFYYMWNAWGEEECRTVFGPMHKHLWEKWCNCADRDLHGATERFYAELSNSNRHLVVERACELYDDKVLHQALLDGLAERREMAERRGQCLRLIRRTIEKNERRIQSGPTLCHGRITTINYESEKTTGADRGVLQS